MSPGALLIGVLASRKGGDPPCSGWSVVQRMGQPQDLDAPLAYRLLEWMGGPR